MDCPCKSGKHFKECCFPIINTAPPIPKTEYSNEKCYAKTYNNCVPKITNEHIVGRVVTKIMKEAHPFKDGKIKMIGPDYLPNIPPIEFKSNILCKRHNEAMSGIDDIGQKFFRILFGQKEENESNFIPGYELERWMLKLLCNLSSSGNWFSKGNKIPKLEPHPTFLKILFEGFPFPEGWGLYILRKVKPSGPLFGISPLITNAIYGLKLKIGYLHYFFAIDDMRGAHEEIIYHPESLILELSEADKREIHLLW